MFKKKEKFYVVSAVFVYWIASADSGPQILVSVTEVKKSEDFCIKKSTKLFLIKIQQFQIKT